MTSPRPTWRTLALATMLVSTASAQPGGGALSTTGAGSGLGTPLAAEDVEFVDPTAFDLVVRVPVTLNNMQRQTAAFAVQCELSGAGPGTSVRETKLIQLDPADGDISAEIPVGFNPPVPASRYTNVSCSLLFCSAAAVADRGRDRGAGGTSGTPPCDDPRPFGGEVEAGLAHTYYDDEETFTQVLSQGL